MDGATFQLISAERLGWVGRWEQCNCLLLTVVGSCMRFRTTENAAETGMSTQQKLEFDQVGWVALVLFLCLLCSGPHWTLHA